MNDKERGLGRHAQPARSSHPADVDAASGDWPPTVQPVLRRFASAPNPPGGRPLTTVRTVLFILSLSAVLWTLLSALVLDRLGPLLLTLNNERAEGLARLFSTPFPLLLLGGLALSGALGIIQRRVPSVAVALAVYMGTCLVLAPVVGSALGKLWRFWTLVKQLGS